MGCSLLTTLIKSSEGYGHRFLEEDPLLKEIADCFSQLDPVRLFASLFGVSYNLPPQFNGTPSSDPIFSKRRMEDTLTAGYFEMLGTLSKYPEGIEQVVSRFCEAYLFNILSRLMERFKLFTAFYHISELRSRDDLIKGIIENIDYTM
jgi:rapamycin-insensitive companion of mTOR